MQGVTTTFLEDVWSRNFLNLFSTPLSIGEYVTGLVASSLLTSAVGLGVMLVLATVFFGLSFFSYGVALIPFLLILLTFGLALGIVGSAIVLWLGPASEWFIWPIPAIVSLVRRSVLSALDTSAVDAIHRAMFTARSRLRRPARDRGQAGCLDRGARVGRHARGRLVAACLVFGAVYRRAVRVGLIARYSAESLS